MDPLQHNFNPFDLAAALVVGLLIGLERGWHDRELPDGSRVAGVRTFALTGLLGGVLGSLIPISGPWPLAAGLFGTALMLAVVFREAMLRSGDMSITSAIAMLLTLALGALASTGAITVALSAAVIAVVLLNFKSTLHAWLRLIEHREMTAALQLLVLSVVILPQLPNAQYGPYHALNPYQLWSGVVLIGSLSLVGHIAMRLTGAQRGTLWTGILGGLASSTAVTLALARQVRRQSDITEAAIAGMISAGGIMFFRLALLVGVIQPSLISVLGLPLVLAGIVMLALGLVRWWRTAPATATSPAVSTAAQDNSMEGMPAFDLSTALGFGVFLAVVAVLVPAASEWLGQTGVNVLSVISGLADVDPMAISLARHNGSGTLTATATAVALALAIFSNTVVKISLAWSLGNAHVGRRVMVAYAIGLSAMLIGARLSA